ncbi:hypothetical protein GJ496_001376 [Pomphorhynchus laevis]|nr:hypothetical protein GJ496_001376 [Pomphorhynchus laevis]
MDATASNNFQIPSWAGKPPNGLHLDVLKEDKMVQKLMIDEKKCYFFGRNRDLCDFSIDHASCSRVHAVLVWHKELNRSFLIDLGSTHGTFVGPVQLESHKPQQIFTGTQFHFGASTRIYVIREKPTVPGVITNIDIAIPTSSDTMELDNLTEFNTAHNRRIGQILSADASTSLKSSKDGLTVASLLSNTKRVTFCEDEQIINPEDFDPTIGRFQNLVQTTIIATNNRKRPMSDEHHAKKSRLKSKSAFSLPPSRQPIKTHFSIASKLGIPMPNPAPDIDHLEARTFVGASLYSDIPETIGSTDNLSESYRDIDNKPRKKYMKEAWPGKKPVLYV